MNNYVEAAGQSNRKRQMYSSDVFVRCIQRALEAIIPWFPLVYDAK